MRILIVEDEQGARGALATLLALRGYVTSVAESAENALDVLRDGCDPAVALVDLDLPGMNGAEFIGKLSNVRPGVFPILISAAETERVSKVLDASVIRLRKPLDFEKLLTILDERRLNN